MNVIPTAEKNYELALKNYNSKFEKEKQEFREMCSKIINEKSMAGLFSCCIYSCSYSDKTINDIRKELKKLGYKISPVKFDCSRFQGYFYIYWNKKRDK